MWHFPAAKLLRDNAGTKSLFFFVTSRCFAPENQYIFTAACFAADADADADANVLHLLRGFRRVVVKNVKMSLSVDASPSGCLCSRSSQCS